MRLSPILAFAQAQVKDVLAAITADGRLWLWDLRSNEPLADVSISDGDTTAIRFTENDTKLEGVGSYRRFEIDFGQIVKRFEQQ